MEQQLKEAVDFFKSENAYCKLFTLFRQKYESLGRVGGTISINSFCKDEIAILAKFFGVDTRELVQKSKISLRDFEKQLTFTRFDLVTLKPLLDAFFGETIISKRERKLREEENLQSFFVEQKQAFPKISFWLDWVMKHRRDSRWLLQMAEQSPEEFVQLLVSLERAFTSLPKRAERLPLFSQRITGDPHAFDLHTSLGKAFIHLLTVDMKQQHGNMMEEIPRDTEAINDLLQQYHIYRDDLLNFVTCYDLMAETKLGVHPVWKEAVEHQTVQIVPLREIIPLTRVYPKTGKIVWVVENSGVCSTLLDDSPNTSIICTNGQFTLATLLLMDLLVEGGATLYYASDFDPEGLGMAERLLKRYGDSLKLWRMDVENYYQTNPKVKLSNNRLEKLTNITDEKLQAIAKEIIRTKKAGYQEALIELMIKDIQEI